MENEQIEEIEDVVVDENPEIDGEINDPNIENETEDEEPKVLEEWEKTEEDDGDKSKPVKFLKAKKRLKGRLSEREDEIARLRAEMETLKAGTSKPHQPSTGQIPQRPREEDFDTDAEYQQALYQYEDKVTAERFSRIEQQRKQEAAVSKAKEKLSADVEGHYERAEKLLEESAISPEVYQSADMAVRQAVETIAPQKGNFVIDKLISVVGPGSEKVMYYLGRNKTALNEFQSILAGDPSGMQAAIYLGQQKERLTNSKKTTTRAPAPAASAKGGETPNGKAGAFLKQYKAAHKTKDGQAAYNAKKAAKSAGIDVSKW